MTASPDTDQTPLAKRPTTMLTEFPDGVVIGWDTCSACHLHVSKCSCKGGPSEPKVFARWRAETQAMPAYGRKAAPTAPTPSTATPAAVASSGPAAGTVACREHGGAVPQAEADKNDDGSWTCYGCQDAGVQRARD